MNGISVDNSSPQKWEVRRELQTHMCRKLRWFPLLSSALLICSPASSLLLLSLSHSQGEEANVVFCTREPAADTSQSDFPHFLELYLTYRVKVN